MSSSLSAWHKKNHKKQVLKNKTARIAARDLKVVETKSISDIDAELRTLTKPYQKDDTVMPHAIRSKVDRLTKERKLLVAEQQKQAE